MEYMNEMKIGHNMVSDVQGHIFVMEILVDSFKKRYLNKYGIRLSRKQQNTNIQLFQLQVTTSGQKKEENWSEQFLLKVYLGEKRNASSNS